MAGLIRAAALWHGADSLAADPDSYRQYATSLLEHGNFLRNGAPSAWRPPLYPLLLAAAQRIDAQSIWSVAALHWLAGLATVALTLLTARALGLRRCALLAALVVTCDPILLASSTQVMTETLATFLASLVLYSLCRAQTRGGAIAALAVGIAGGLAILCRPTFALWMIACLPLVGAAAGKRYQPRWAAMALLVAMATLAPWAIRNALQLGQPLITTTHGGYTLLLGNNPRFYDFLRQRRRGETWDSAEFVQAWQQTLAEEEVASEIDEDALAYRLARAHIAAAGRDFLRAAIYRQQSFWRLAPLRAGPTGTRSAQFARLAIAGWYFAVFALALVGLLWIERVGWRLWLPSLLLIATLAAAHLFYWTDMRMRAPAMPAFALLAAAGAAWIDGQLSARKDK
ncbi:MAG: glycosyltransferase family 39 protein [Pirellulales bacterium]|nr:glycosyltransferase family 39 protein [Pirellulales bacterium]